MREQPSQIEKPKEKEILTPANIEKAGDILQKELDISEDESPEEIYKKVAKNVEKPGFVKTLSKKARTALAILIATGVLGTALPSLSKAETPKEPQGTELAMSGQERAGLVRAIEQRKNVGQITGEEANGLISLVNLDKGYTGMLKDYMTLYKAKGKSVDDFMGDLYGGKVGPGKKG